MSRAVRAIALSTLLAAAWSGLGSPASGTVSTVVDSRAAAGSWTCRWAPTMDNNWHNDALCSNGAKQVRPYLRPGDTYITRDELMASAQAWARARNRGR